MEADRIPKAAPKRRPKMSWLRTGTDELARKGGGGAYHVAKDRERWRELTGALFPTGDEED